MNQLIVLTFLSQINVLLSSDRDYFSATSEMAKLFSWEQQFVSSLQECHSKLISGDRDTCRSVMNFTKHFPGSSDQWEGTLQGLFLLQNSFNLNISEFSRGIVQIGQMSEEQFTSHASLAYEDIDSLAKTAYNRYYYNRAVEWFREAVNSAVATKAAAVVTAAKNLLKTTIKVHDKVLDTKGPDGSSGGNFWKTNPVPFDEKLRKKKKFKKLQKIEQNSTDQYKFQVVHSLKSEIITDQFNRLCRGEKLLKPEDLKDLNCFYLHHKDPYTRLGPFKLDDQHSYPYITVFRDFFSDREMEYYKDISRDNLERSGYGSSKSDSKDGSTTGNSRTSKQTWLSEFNNVECLDYSNMTRHSIGPYITHDKLVHCSPDTVAMRLTDRINHATRMYTRVTGGGENYQIANYGLGGYYDHHPDPHMWHHHDFTTDSDFVRSEMTMMGDRLATFMGYLSDTELGGGTAFPNAGVAVKVSTG